MRCPYSIHQIHLNCSIVMSLFLLQQEQTIFYLNSQKVKPMVKAHEIHVNENNEHCGFRNTFHP
jgi:hypothetical protein